VCPVGVICSLLSIWLLAVFVRIVLSWFPVSPGGAMAGVTRALGVVTDPVLEPLRRMLPPLRVGGVGLDLSPMVVLLAGSFILRAVC